METQAPTPTESELLQVRRDKLAALAAKGIAPFGGKYENTHDAGTLKAEFVEGLEVKVGGRVLAKRTMGKAIFFDIGDFTGRIQCYVNKKEVGDDAFEMLASLVDMGDWIGVDGLTFVTRMGEKSIQAKTLTFLSKSLRPLPDKWHGITDKELKYRQRYLDLISNDASREIFVTRSKMIAEIRRYLQDRNFMEVETPMMQDIAGGAAARPFETYHNALDMPLYLRIAPELFLKRLLVGGFTRIFELNRNFRNEGISRRHNPEFTMLEAYWAFADFEQMADLVEGMICHLAEKFCGGLKLEHKDAEGNVTKTIDLTRPWRRASYKELLSGIDAKWWDYTPEERKARAKELGVEIGANFEDYEVSQHMFEKLIEEKSFNPLFVTHCPKQLVPLAKQNASDDSVVDVYELVINGQEISPGLQRTERPHRPARPP